MACSSKRTSFWSFVRSVSGGSREMDLSWWKKREETNKGKARLPDIQTRGIRASRRSSKREEVRTERHKRHKRHKKD